VNIEIIEEPIRFHLHGIEGVVQNERYAEVGLRLMDAIWQAVKGAKIPNTGINHWVYLSAGRMFVGVEFRNAQQASIPDLLRPLEFELKRSMKHVHVGPYQELPRKWKDLQAELIARGEIIGSPSLEVYGHHWAEPSKLETTILIGLQPKPERATCRKLAALTRRIWQAGPTCGCDFDILSRRSENGVIVATNSG